MHIPGIMHHRTSGTFLLSIVATGMLTGCGHKATTDATAELPKLSAEVEDTRHRLDAAQKALEEQMAAVASAVAAADKIRQELAVRDQTVVKREADIKALQGQLAELKKSDAFAYAEASGVQARGLTSSALARYQKFLEDFPKSPLVADANRAVAELAVASQRSKAAMADPKKEEEGLAKRFGENVVSLDEISPALKNRSIAEVLKLLGPPNKTFRNGSEIGYVDKVLDPATGQRDTLVIIFDADRVSGLRIGYRGREIKP